MYGPRCIRPDSSAEGLTEPSRSYETHVSYACDGSRSSQFLSLQAYTRSHVESADQDRIADIMKLPAVKHARCFRRFP